MWHTFTESVATLFADLHAYPVLTTQIMAGLTNLLVAVIEHDGNQAAHLCTVARAEGEAFVPFAQALLTHSSSHARGWVMSVLASLDTPWAHALLTQHAPLVSMPLETSTHVRRFTAIGDEHGCERVAEPAARGNVDERELIQIPQASKTIYVRHPSMFSPLTSAPNIGADTSGSIPNVRCSLTPTEWQVLQVLRNGKTNHQIAAQLSVSESPVRFHLGNIYAKLGITNRTQAIAWLMNENVSTD